MSLKGRCLCEGIQFEISEAPQMMGICHCTRCQRFGGGAYSTVLVIHPDHLSFSQGEDLLHTYSQEGFADRAFCSTCGSSLYGQAGDMMFIEAGALAEDPEMRPGFHMMTAYKAPWDEITDELPQFPEFPPMG